MEFTLLELGKVPARSWNVASDPRDWMQSATTVGKEGFAPGVLAELPRCPLWVQIERFLVYPVYFFSFCVLPVAIPNLPLLRLVSRFPSAKQWLATLVLQFVLARFQQDYWKLLLRSLTKDGREQRRHWGLQRAADTKAKVCHLQIEDMFVMERQNHRYFGTKWIFPKSVATVLGPSKRLLEAPCIICFAPHGLVPFGYSSAGSKVLGRLVRWAGAPVLFRMPAMRRLLEKFGTYPAGKDGIRQCLAQGDHAGVVLDGIAGMFHGGGPDTEELWLLRRKAVCAIAISAGCAIVPAYTFGNNDCCKIVDPLCGLLRNLSIRLDVSLTPFLGRFWLPMGPPARRPLAVCFGDPVECPKVGTSDAVDVMHVELLEAFRTIFDTHKAAYGRPNARLHFV